MAPHITKHLINRNCTFINQMYPPLVFVVHRTAGHVNVQQLFDYWNASCVSSHFGISYDGYGYDPHDIWQFVNLWDGSGANCCPESGHHPFFDRGGNANVYTISVEVCTPNTNNQGLMTDAQVESLVYLIQTVCAELGIPTDQTDTYWNDYEDAYTFIGSNGGVGMHRDVSPHNKRMCPGDPYYQNQMKDIMRLVNSGVQPTEEDEDHMHMDLEQGKSYVATLPNVATVWLSAAQGDADIYVAFYKSGSGAYTAKTYTVGYMGNPMSVARSEDSDITKVLVTWRAGRPVDQAAGMCASLDIIKTGA